MPSPPCKVIHFKSREELDSLQQLKAFIAHARDVLDLFDTDQESTFDWEEISWDTDGRQKSKGFNSAKKNSKKSGATINFTAIGSTRWHATPMSKPLIDFAKAYIRYDLTFNWQRKVDSHLAGFKVIEAALIKLSSDGVADITKIEATTLDVAAEYIRESYTGDTRYHIAWRLIKITEFLAAHEILDGKIAWKNPFPVAVGGRVVGDEKKLAEKLPDRVVLEALGTIFYAATDPRDVLTTSMACVLSAGPSRASEVVHCQNKIEVWFDNKDGTKDLGLEWYPAKGGEDGAKPIPKDFEPIVIRALEKIREITDEARRIALFYEQQGSSPASLYLPKKLEHLRKKEWITNQEVCHLYGWRKACDVPKLMDAHEIESKKERVEFPGRKRLDGTQGITNRVIKVYSFASIEKHILGYIPQNFPWLDKENGIKYSDALFITHRNFNNPQKGTQPCMFEACQYSTLHRRIGIANKNNIFALHGFKMPDGSPMTLLTHQIRRWLNTIADRGGMSDWERDFWSGRKQSSDKEMVSRTSRAYIFNSLDDYLESSGLTQEIIDQTPFEASLRKRPVSLQDFIDQDGKPLFHANEYGLCHHSFSLKPCGVHEDCLNCTEHASVKGDKVKTERVRKVHDLNVKQLKVCEDAIEEEYRNADQWYQSTLLSVMRTRSLLEILDDPSNPDDGSVIVVLSNPFQYSAFRNAVEYRAGTLGDISSQQIAKQLELPTLPPLQLPEN